MIVNFANLDLHERPTLILKNAGDTPLGVLGHAYNIDFDGNYNEISVLTFNVPSKVDNEPVPYYNDLIGMRVIELPNIGNFTLITPVEKNDGTSRYKECQAYSLEYEFSYKKITVANDTYKFWDNDPTNVSRTILGMIMELMPSWHVTRVSASLVNKYRTFEVNNENLYNFIKNTIQQSYGCIFDFNTLDRSVTVRDVDDDSIEEPVYLSMDNLVKEIEIHEETENMVTRLDVTGADGVDIRDVNPTGTNSIVNLDYYMNTTNFTQALIDKYYAWKELCDNNRPIYYAKSVKYTLMTMQAAVERASLTDLEGELTNLDNQRAVLIQAVSQGVSTQSDYNAANREYSAKKVDISTKKNSIEALEESRAELLAELKAIVNACSFNSYFTSEERVQLDRYIRDGEISEPSFVSTTVAYSDDGLKFSMEDAVISLTGASIEQTTDSSGTIVDIRGGSFSMASFGNVDVISAVLSYGRDNSMVFTASLSTGTISGESFDSGSLTVTGTIAGNRTITSSSLSATITGYAYFTLNPGEYQRRSVAWELYEYGEKMAEKLSQPTFTFSVDSANFLALEEFESFKNHLRLGEKIYLDNDGEMLKPICIGVHCNFDDLTTLELKFGDSYVRSDTAFKLADILEQSVTTGRTLSTGKFNFEEFSKSGASTTIGEFMRSAIDLSRNRILESSQQAISMDNAGLRLRKWANESETAYEDEQIWMNNNSVLMTDDNWETAKMAIGKFRDPNLGSDLWGILAPTIVGTLLAGEQLVIESRKSGNSGETLMFRVDGDGCRMYNGDISVISDGGTLWTYDVDSDSDVYSEMDTTSTKIATAVEGATVIVTERLRDESTRQWGRVIMHDGKTGWMLLANSTVRNDQGETGARHIVMHPDVGIVIGKYPAIIEDENGHCSVNSSNASMWVDVVGNMYLNGYATFDSLSTPGQTVIDGGNITTGEINADLIKTGHLSANRISGGTIDARNVTIDNLSANDIKTGTFSASRIRGGSIDATDVTITNLSASNIKTGYLSVDRIEGGTITADKLVTSVQTAINNVSNVSNANLKSQTIYISKQSGTMATDIVMPSQWVETASDVQNQWTSVRPTYYTSYPVLFIATQMQSVGGTVTCTTPHIDTTTTVIDGGRIITGSIDVGALSSGSISANLISGGTLKLGGFNGTYGNLQIKNARDEVKAEMGINRNDAAYLEFTGRRGTTTLRDGELHYSDDTGTEICSLCMMGANYVSTAGLIAASNNCTIVLDAFGNDFGGGHISVSRRGIWMSGTIEVGLDRREGLTQQVNIGSTSLQFYNGIYVGES